MENNNDVVQGLPLASDGWRKVPRLPTPDQLRAAMKFCADPELAKSIYLAMVDAAPRPSGE